MRRKEVRSFSLPFLPLPFVLSVRDSSRLSAPVTTQSSCPCLPLLGRQEEADEEAAPFFPSFLPLPAAGVKEFYR